MCRLLITVVLLACSTVSAQDTKQFVLAGSRGGVIELIDPTSLETLGRLHIDLPPKGVGLNGVSASVDVSTIYVEGPIAGNPRGCCSVYSIDLATLQMNQAVSIPGSPSIPGSRSPSRAEIKEMSNDRLQRSPDGHWLFGVRSFRGPTLDVYDLVQGSIVRQLTPKGLEGDWHPSGTWSGDQFYFYASKYDGSSARLWTVSPDTIDLGAGVAVEPFAQVPDCHPNSFALEEIAAAGNNLFAYEAFGFIGDRRGECSNPVPGGAWLIDPSTGQSLRHVAPDLHFSALIPDRGEKPVLYGLSSGGPNWEFPVQIVRIDARDGQVLQSRTLDTDRWNISIAALRMAPTGDVRVTQGQKSNVK
jgi:hypothetical protein